MANVPLSGIAIVEKLAFATSRVPATAGAQRGRIVGRVGLASEIGGCGVAGLHGESPPARPRGPCGKGVASSFIAVLPTVSVTQQQSKEFWCGTKLGVGNVRSPQEPK